IYKQVPISKENGTPNFSFRVFTIEPGGHTPLHNHPFEHLNYIIEGKGTVISGGKEHELKKGDFVLIQPGETHQYRNTSGSKDSFIMICAVPKEYE
ncbi:MAG: cupin domain-containing protein, partial [Chloroflexi bacterium]|nr:cupin domain-containing protein [Chloroflexota bacterium]